MPSSVFSRTLRFLRKSCCWTAEKTAKHFTVHWQTILRWEKAQQEPPEWVQRAVLADLNHHADTHKESCVFEV